MAPRLCDVAPSEEQALEDHAQMMRYVVRMLCAGLVHGDLSEFNVLVDRDGPVIIDLPQAVDAAGNNSAPMLLVRDVDTMRDWFGRFEPALLGLFAGVLRSRSEESYGGLLQAYQVSLEQRISSAWAEAA